MIFGFLVGWFANDSHSWLRHLWKSLANHPNRDQKITTRHIFKGLRPVLKGFVVTMHEGACETGSQIPRALGCGIWRYSSHKPECIVKTNPDRSVLITIITWHFQFRDSRFAYHSHCYVTRCPLTGIVASQFPSSRDAALVTRYLTPFISACLKSLKRFLPQ